jgi:Rrf2 family protein
MSIFAFNRNRNFTMLSKENKICNVSSYKSGIEIWRWSYSDQEILLKMENIPQRFLESILLELKKMGILGSKLGKSGGYFLIKSPGEVSLLDVIRHFEGTIALMYCVSEKAYQPCEFCKIEETCKIRHVFKKIRDNTYDILQEATLASLI